MTSATDLETTRNALEECEKERARLDAEQRESRPLLAQMREDRATFLGDLNSASKALVPLLYRRLGPVPTQLVLFELSVIAPEKA